MTLLNQNFHNKIHGMVTKCKVANLTTQEIKLGEGLHNKTLKNYKRKVNIQ